MRTPRLSLAMVAAVALISLAASGLGAAEKISQPFVGVTHVDRTEASPRPRENASQR